MHVLMQRMKTRLNWQIGRSKIASNVNSKKVVDNRRVTNIASVSFAISLVLVFFVYKQHVYLNALKLSTGCNLFPLCWIVIAFFTIAHCRSWAPLLTLVYVQCSIMLSKLKVISPKTIILLNTLTEICGGVKR